MDKYFLKKPFFLTS